MTADGVRFRLVASLVACAAIIGAGFVIMAFLWMLRKPPEEVQVQEIPLRVEAKIVEPEDYPVSIVEHGVARALNVAPMTAEVSGQVVEVHPNLEMGERIKKGETLFVVDPRDYEAQVAGAEAEVGRLGTSIQRIQTEWENDKTRLNTLSRSRDLARAEFARIKELFEKDEVGTRSAVEAAERQMNIAQDTVDQLQRQLNVYPLSIQEMKNQLAAAQARLDQARTALARTSVIAPFDARVQAVNVEFGQFVSPGTPVVTLADDSLIEISVSCDSRDVRDWLKFRDEAAPDAAWFASVEPVQCTVRWTEAKENYVWYGTLHRVEQYEADTRRVTLAIRVDGSQAAAGGARRLPLVDGMFCVVEIPGRTMKDVYELPEWAVTFSGDLNKGHAYVAVNDRLQTVPVTVVRRQLDLVYVKGLQPGDVVITTRLVNPLTNSLLEVVPHEELTRAL